MHSAVFGLALMLTLSPVWNASRDDTPHRYLAQTVQDASLLERTREFTDLYLIHTRDKGRNIIIYCGSHSCYKSKPPTMYG
ncbi:hypothetical protein CHH28_18645 [Bacterioplanes sanyensis]|uniref:Uncharacterized protein n=1 Tax=Bacterioplanes sanyensis TaxID=1249553 RepID=A0A222FQ83_9GAMM|nr:hypothetical protein CHH28_18645 [Bacterioplanes sanyensis]